MSAARFTDGPYQGEPITGQCRCVSIRGLAVNLREWGTGLSGAPLVLCHGWLDTSASWQFVVAALTQGRPVVAHDWRGFGRSAWSGADNYWFQDYVADLDGVAEAVSPDAPFDLVGHSMGAQAASLYAGVRPARIRRLVLMDDLSVPDMPADGAPKRLGSWLDEIRKQLPRKSYESFEHLAERIRNNHDGLTAERALAVAHGWGRQADDGLIELAADPVHRRRGPTLYRAAESKAVWANVTAPTLILDAEKSGFPGMAGADEMAERRRCFADARHQVIPDCGHMMHFDQPEAVAAAIEQHLAA